MTKNERSELDNFVLGLWLLIAPFTLGYSGTAATEDVIVGIAIAILAL